MKKIFWEYKMEQLKNETHKKLIGNKIWTKIFINETNKN